MVLSLILSACTTERKAGAADTASAGKGSTVATTAVAPCDSACARAVADTACDARCLAAREAEERDGRHCTPEIWIAAEALDEARKELDETLIAALLRTNTKKCESNVEFGEMFNEAMFRALDNNPAGFVTEFARIPNQERVLEDLREPVNDGIDTKKILAKLAKLARLTPADRESYDKIVQAVQGTP